MKQTRGERERAGGNVNLVGVLGRSLKAENHQSQTGHGLVCVQNLGQQPVQTVQAGQEAGVRALVRLAAEAVLGLKRRVRKVNNAHVYPRVWLSCLVTCAEPAKPPLRNHHLLSCVCTGPAPFCPAGLQLRNQLLVLRAVVVQGRQTGQSQSLRGRGLAIAALIGGARGVA